MAISGSTLEHKTPNSWSFAIWKDGKLIHKYKQDFTFFKVKLSQLVHINFQAGENSHSYFFLCVEGMTEGLSRKVLLFEIIYVTFLL